MYKPIDDVTATPKTVFAEAGGSSLGLAPLRGEESVDAVVIGGGFVGCSAALHIAERGMRVVLLEANEIGWGSAGRNVGQVAPRATKFEPETVLKIYGPVYGARLNDAGAGAPDFVTDLADRYDIDITVVRSGILTAAHTPAAAETLRQRTEYWQRLKVPVEFLTRREASEVIGSDDYHGAMIDRRGIAINPLAFVRGLALAAISQGAVLYERTRMTGLTRVGEEWRVATDEGALKAQHVLLCTNAYTDDAWPGLKKTVIPVRGYQIWSKPLSKADRGRILRGISAMVDTRRLLSGMRLHPDGRLQFSGGLGLGREIEPELAKRLGQIQAIFPDIGLIEAEGWWSGWVTRGISDGWRLHRLAPGLLTAIACNGRGVAMGAIMGRELARHVCGVPAEDLIIALTRPRQIPGFAFHKSVAALALRFWGWKDRREIRQATKLVERTSERPAA
ncbi:MAG: FAD-dependent oxidoreductase [Rhodospirillales bacterium]|nr:FAD-dependent oxidoreductase [Rhodospirillales bacterium]